MQSGVVTLGQVAARLAMLAGSCNRRPDRPIADRVWRRVADAAIAPDRQWSAPVSPAILQW